MIQSPLRPSTIADYRSIAKVRLPQQLFEFVDGGSFAEETLAANRADFAKIKLRQRVCRAGTEVDLTASVLGEKWSMPVGLAPIGLAGLMRRRGEVQALRAAQKAGAQFCLSTSALCSIEELAGASTRPFWFQLYIMRDRGFVADLIARAKRAACSVLVLTVDLPVGGLRHRDVQTGMSGGLAIGGRMRVAADRARRFSWLWDVALRGGPHLFGNMSAAIPDAKKLSDFYAFTAANFDPTVSWKDVEWVRNQWGGTLVLKGILDPEDARCAVAAGAQGVIVSNHGGRQLDGVSSTIGALAPIAEAVGGRAEILLDGGVRNGIDVIRALALGAKACLLGRAWAFALAAAGERGVAAMLETMRHEMSIAMTLSGVSGINQLDRSVLDPTAVTTRIN